MINQKAFSANEIKPYWSWRCSCGYNDNRNNNYFCKKCGEKISCQTAGGHNGIVGKLCEGGCGKVMY